MVFLNCRSVFQCRIELEKARLLVLEAADQLDRLGNKRARGTIAMAKVNPSFCIFHVLLCFCLHELQVTGLLFLDLSDVLNI